MKKTKGSIIIPATSSRSSVDTGFNKIVNVSEHLERLHAIRGSFIVRRTTQYCSPRTASGLVLPGDGEADVSAFEKKYDIGEVVKTGGECVDIKVGQIVVYQRNAAMRIPNGTNGPIYFKLEETPMAVLCVIDPQPEKERVVFTSTEVANAAN